MSGKTITTYLLTGETFGPKTVFISNKICKALVVPRSCLNSLEKRVELHQPALYFLINEETEQIYIGETENFFRRSRDHISNKNFWETAIIFISKDNDLTKSDIKYLEYLALKEANLANRFNLDENKTNPNPTSLPEHQASSVEEFFKDIKILTSFLGFYIFEIAKKNKSQMFFCTGRGAKAKGFFQKNGFTVLKGSIIASDVTTSYQDKKIQRDKKISKCGGQLESSKLSLQKDLTFKTPSAASSFCVGNNSNGWISWINDKKETLDQVYRTPNKN